MREKQKGKKKKCLENQKDTKHNEITKGLS